MRTVKHMSWNEFRELEKSDADVCCCKGDAYMTYDGNVPKFKYITDIHEGYGRSNYIWDEMDIVIDN